MKTRIKGSHNDSLSPHPSNSYSTLLTIIAVIGLLLAVEGPIATVSAAASGSVILTVVAVSSTEVDVTWTPSTATGVKGYTVRRDGQKVMTVDSNTLSYVDTSVQPSTKYTYSVDVLLSSNSKPESGKPAKIKTPASPDRADVTPPSPPEEFSAVPAAGGGILLDWYYATDDSDIGGYRIYRDGKLLATVDSGTMQYIDAKVKPGSTHIYRVVAEDITGRRSKPETATAAASRLFSERLGPTTSNSATAAISNPVTGFDAALRRYPYLTDLVGPYVTINWATDTSASNGTARWGQVAQDGSCDPNTAVIATRTTISVNSVYEYQWKANLTLNPDTQFCYRVFLPGIDLLGASPSPKFWTQVPGGSTTAYSFAVLGDWGSADSNGANPDQANLMRQIANSGVRFAVTVGDNAYNSGSQTNYGDLIQTGPSMSAVFGPSFWAVPGSSVAIFSAVGNHGFASTASTHPQLVNFPQDRAVSTSTGKYVRETYSGLNGTKSASYPSAWYAFDAGAARFYVLDAAWADGNVGNGTMYSDDYAYHWQASSPEFQWLNQDLAAHASQIKFAFFHFPPYSDNATENSDTYLQGANRLVGLLGQYGVNLAFTGHAHLYQRNAADTNGLVTYLTGGGGGKLEPQGGHGCSPNDAYGIGWSYSANGGLGGGSACGRARKPVSIDQVFHFLKVTVAGHSVTVTPTDEMGRAFDVQTYQFNAGDSQAPSIPADVTATSNDPAKVDVAWSASTDDVGVASYSIYRDSTQITTVDGSTLNYSDTTVQPGVTYRYTVDALDVAGNRSPQSTPAEITTPDPDVQPPSVPGGITAAANVAIRVEVDWEASTDNVAVTGYDIYRDGALLLSVDGASTSYIDTTVDPASTYHYQVLARDVAGNVSTLSDAANVTTGPGTFSDGFEQGNLSLWTSNGGLSVENTLVHTGSYAVQGNTTNGGTYAKKSLPATYTEGYARIYFDIVSASSQVNLLRFRTATDGSLVYVYVSSTGKLGLRNDVAGINLNSATAVGSGWHMLELHAQISGASSIAEVWFDGQPIGDLTTTDSLGTTPIGRFQIGEVQSGRTYNVAFDDVLFDQ